MKFPKSLSNKNGVTVFPHKLVCINGSASVRLELKNVVIANKDIVSTRQKTSEVKMRVSRYIGYELGIGKSALEKTKIEIEKSIHPKRLTVLQTIAKLNHRLASIIELRKNTPMDPQLSVLISEFNRDTVLLLSLALGARALLENSPVGRWQLETILFDAVIQSPKSIELKIQQLSRN